MAHRGGGKIHIGFSCGNLKKEQIGRTKLDGRMILELILKNRIQVRGLD